jgi:putative phosphoesterase
MIGVISDTHGLLRPEALAALRGSSHILHAGDVGDIDILDALKQIAPVTAIRGNIDTDGPTAQLPATEVIELEGHLIYLLHSLADLDLKPEAAGMSVVISGHSHKPKIETRTGVLYLNPGSAGPRRFSLPITVAHLHLDATPRAEIITLSSQE